MSGLPEVLMAARFRLAIERPYLSTALWALQPREVKGMAESGPGPIGVDRWFRLYYDPEAIAKWSVGELAAVLYHEVGHLLRDHAGRAESRGIPMEPGPRFLWNLAGDLEINDDIVADNMTLPKDACLPQAFGLPDGLFLEEYYDKLMEQAEKVKMPPPVVSGGACGGCAGNGAEHEESPEQGDMGERAVTASEAELIRHRVALDVQAHEQKSRGTVPAWLKRWAEGRLRPTVPWRQVLASLIRRACGDVRGLVDFTYQRPSRRAAALGNVVLPALRQPTPRVSVVVDTSGSMSAKELAQALAEIEGVLAAVGLRDGVVVHACDAAVAATKRVFRAADVVLAGGGGTDMRVGLEAAVAARPRPDVVVVVTDGDTPWPREAPKVPVIVALTQRVAEAPPAWARVVQCGLA